MSTDAPVPMPSRFDVMPHKPDGGGGSFAGALQLTAILGSVGILLGLAVSFLSQWIYLILLFPLGMGFLLGLVGAKTIERYKIRKPLICGIAGFAAGCFCFLAMHYLDYRRFESHLSEVPEEIRAIAQNIDRLEAQGFPAAKIEGEAEDEQAKQTRQAVEQEIRDVITQLRAAPDQLAALQVNSFWDFMDLQAKEGVTLSRAGHGGNGINLGYVGSFIYWCGEALIVAVMALAIMMTSASQPFCRQCDCWKREIPLIGSPVDPHVVAESVQQGDLAALEQTLTTNAPQTNKPQLFTKISAAICANCESASPVEVKVVKVKTNSKGETSDSTVAHISYPGEALEPRCKHARHQERHASDLSSPRLEELAHDSRCLGGDWFRYSPIIS